MTTIEPVLLCCDGTDCGNFLDYSAIPSARSKRQARAQGRREGWQHRRNGADLCPTCPTLTRARATVVPLAAWLHQRYTVGHILPFSALGEADRTYWEHEAAAVRRAVARGGFKAPAPQPETCGQVGVGVFGALGPCMRRPHSEDVAHQNSDGAQWWRTAPQPETAPDAARRPPACPDCGTPTRYQPLSGASEWYCPREGCEASGLIPASAPDACPRCGRPAGAHDRPCTITTTWPTTPDTEVAHVVADDSTDPEHVDDCPGCEEESEPGFVVTAHNPRKAILRVMALGTDDPAKAEAYTEAADRATTAPDAEVPLCVHCGHGDGTHDVNGACGLCACGRRVAPATAPDAEPGTADLRDGDQP